VKTDICAAAPGEAAADALIVPYYQDRGIDDAVLAAVNASLDGALSRLAEGGELRGRRDEVVYLHEPRGIAAGRLVLVGMGRAEADHGEHLRRAIGVGVRHMRGKRHKHLAVVDSTELSAAQAGALIVEAVTVAAGELSICKTEDRDDLHVEALTVVTSPDREAEVRRGVERGAVVAAGMTLCRDLGNAPGAEMTPRILAERAATMAASHDLGCEILDEDAMKELGMGALLGVSRGSEEPARLIVLRYEPEGPDDDQIYAFVGKGLTFDSGGISIKPRDGMEWMKYDMCGGAAVIGALQAIAQLKPAKRVLGVVAASENLPSGKSYKPGDVLRSYLGKTIEVVNTDAEGRLILADALAYSIHLGATRLVDLATLTGACVVALGHVYAAVMGNDQAWTERVLESAKRGGERLWQLPMDKSYREQIRSDIADIKNLGGRAAGTITAGYFLKEFVGSTPWAHMDIAGTAWVEDDRPDIAKGATGYGVPTLVELVAPSA
jgi:leucyl aminopeptidase